MVRALPALLLLALATPAAAAPGDIVDCLDADRIDGREGAGPAALVFRLRDGRAFRNDLRGPCPGIKDVGGFRYLVVYPAVGSRLCRGDFVAAADRVALPGGAAAPRCPLGRFTELPSASKPQARGGPLDPR